MRAAVRVMYTKVGVTKGSGKPSLGDAHFTRVRSLSDGEVCPASNDVH